jgi:hypothetical protein
MNWKTILAAGAILFTGTLYAQTPDGITPADEDICDSESGAAYGLCNAYCEAMDCDYELTSAAEMACLKVRDRFVQQTGRDVPCITPPPECPCYTYQEVAYIAETESSADRFYCYNGPDNSMILWQSIESTVGIPFDPFDERDAKAYEYKWQEEAELGCEYRHYVYDGENATEVLRSWVVAPNVENRIVYEACKDIMDAVFETYAINCD